MVGRWPVFSSATSIPRLEALYAAEAGLPSTGDDALFEDLDNDLLSQLNPPPRGEGRPAFVESR